MFEVKSLLPVLGSMNTVKNGVNTPIRANAPGRLVFFIIAKTPRVRCNRPGALFFALFREEGPAGREPTTREGVRKGPATEAERDASQHAVGGIARVSFFLFDFINQINFFLQVSRPVDSTRPD